ncbi:MAG: response regulator transcription factor [Proteobacteria bacterium]|nr:response regulator transcription factor [Pseudomonadota bacterium]
MGQARILIVDDHPLVRVGLRTALQAAFPAALLSEAATLAQAQACLAQTAHNAAILDLTLPDSAGIATLLALAEQCPGMPILVVSGTEPEALRGLPGAEAAAAVLSKGAGPDALIEVLGSIMATTPESPVDEAVRLVLTPREKDILVLCAQGLQNKVIGRSLGISENTVRAHLASVFKRFGLSQRSEVKALLEQAGLI